MNIDRERFGSGALPIWVHHEHKARWLYGCNYVSDKVVVDCACGAGEGSYMFANAGARHVYAFDLSDDAVSTTQKRCANLPNITVQQASGLSLPLEDGSVDVFVSFETIEHIEDDQGFLNEVARLLAPNGVFLCSTPNRTITMPGKTLKDKPWNPFHIREYNSSEFKALLEGKFINVTLLGQNATPQWRISLLEMIGKSMPGHTGGRLNSGLKIPRFFYDKLESHLVDKIPQHGSCEYIVAICRTQLLTV